MLPSWQARLETANKAALIMTMTARELLRCSDDAARAGPGRTKFSGGRSSGPLPPARERRPSAGASPLHVCSVNARGVIHPIADHGDLARAVFFKLLDGCDLLFGHEAGTNFFDADALGDLFSHLAAISCQHDGTQAHPAEIPQGPSGFRSHHVAKDHASKKVLARDPDFRSE